jgi:hypothetical protein
VAKRVQENIESGTDFEPVVEEASNHCSKASKQLRERKWHGYGEANKSFELHCSEASKPSRERKWQDSEMGMESEEGTKTCDLLGSPRVTPLFFAGLQNNVMLLFTRWLMHDCDTKASHAYPGALDTPFNTHVFGDNSSAKPRCREVARWVQENEESVTDYEPVVEKL